MPRVFFIQRKGVVRMSKKKVSILLIASIFALLIAGPIFRQAAASTQGGEFCREETAWAFGNVTFIQLGIGNNWGWVFDYTVGSGPFVTDLWAGAGQNNINNGTLVGNVTVTDDGTNLYVTFNITAPNWTMGLAHLYVGTSNPTTAAPGQLGHNSGDLPNLITYTFTVPLGSWGTGTQLKLAAHAEVGQLCDVPTNTHTFTPTPTVTNTYTFTPTPTVTNTYTFTPTPTVTNTYTFTPTPTVTNTYTFTPTPTVTNTYTFTPTLTVTNTYTFTPTPTVTNTYTFTPTNTPTNTLVVTPSKTQKPTRTLVPTKTPTSTKTVKASKTPTPTKYWKATSTPKPPKYHKPYKHHKKVIKHKGSNCWKK
jgi:hypothetical protein